MCIILNYGVTLIPSVGLLTQELAVVNGAPVDASQFQIIVGLRSLQSSAISIVNTVVSVEEL